MLEVLTNPVVLTVIGLGLGWGLKYAKDFVKKTENPYDDLAFKTAVKALKLADKEFDEPYFDTLAEKALEKLEDESVATEKLKEVVEKK